MKYSLEQVFPEVNKLDYDRLVQPLLTFNRNHLNLKKINLQNKQILVSNISENYPYQKIRKLISKINRYLFQIFQRIILIKK